MNQSLEAQMRQASMLLRQGRRAEALDAYRRLVEVRPEEADAWYNLGYLLRTEGRYEEALAAYGRALETGVHQPEGVRLNRAAIFSDHLRDDGAAADELNAALQLRPGFAPALLNLGNLHEERGARAEAIGCYEQLLSGSSDADRHLRHQALARMTHLCPPDSADSPLLLSLREAAEAMLDQDEERANLLFALGRAYDSLGLYDEAFSAFSKAHRCVRKRAQPYDRALARARTDALKSVFSSHGPAGPRDEHRPAPLFICGMFRSGSTLLEQMLAAHPEVTAGGELDFMPRLVTGALAPFPSSMVNADQARDEQIARDYLDHLDRLFPESRHRAYVTDKRPDNFLLIGLIKRLFPNAKVLHTTRHPLDNGLSIFMQHLDPRVASYSHELGDIGHHYGQYRRLMAHWKSVFGPDILDVEYEALVREPRQELERVLAFLGLQWNDRCLKFHQLANTVKTASYWQVRQPLYLEATGRWRKYHQHLVPLRAGLRESGVKEADDT
jgi:tetratricopeptide (TPR) repeat protein